jgi:regulation of enolase protein 1 (concanavalin A-like superfamily)
VDIKSIVLSGPIYLRIARFGDLWIFRYSMDGSAWQTFASTTHSLAVTQVGAFAGNHGTPASSSPAFTGELDYFFNTASPIGAEDAQVRVSIGDVSLSEGDSGTTDFVFPVSVDADPFDTVIVDAATADGTATVADDDYTGVTEQLTFTPGGGLVQYVTVSVNGDTVLEPDETFTLALELVSGAASILDGEGIGTILNDEAVPPSVSIDDVSLPEGDAGTTDFVFTVTLSADPPGPVAIDYATADETATVADSDYSLASGQLTFNPGGALSQPVAVTVNGDAVTEFDETFVVNLAVASGSADLADAQGEGTILDDDTAPPPGPAIVSDDFSTGVLNTSLWTFVDPRGDSTLELNGTQAIVSVPAGVSHDLWTNALYAPRLLQDVPDEDFEIEVKYESAVTSKFQIQGIVVQQDLENLIRFDLYNAGAGPRLFAAKFTNGSASAVKNQAVSVPGPIYLRLTRAGDGWTFRYSLNGESWTQIATTNHVLAVSQVGAFVGNHGAPESSSPAFSGALDYFFNTASPIEPEDASVVLSINDVSIAEGNAGTTDFVFTVSASMNPIDTIAVNYATVDDTATVVGGDYQATNGQLTFTPGGALEQTIVVPVNGDTSLESDETFFVELTLQSGTATIGDGVGVGTILNDETPPPTVTIDDIALEEGDSGTTPFGFTVSLSANPDAPVTVSYATANGTATTADGDYGATSGQLTFNPGGALSQPVNVLVNGDMTVEEDETFLVNIALISGPATISDGQGEGTILDDDDETPPAIVSDDFSTGVLNTSLWTFVDPRGDSSLAMNGTHASISTPAGVSHDLWTGTLYAPRLLQDAPDTDFEIEV